MVLNALVLRFTSGCVPRPLIHHRTLWIRGRFRLPPLGANASFWTPSIFTQLDADIASVLFDGSVCVVAFSLWSRILIAVHAAKHYRTIQTDDTSNATPSALVLFRPLYDGGRLGAEFTYGDVLSIVAFNVKIAARHLQAHCSAAVILKGVKHGARSSCFMQVP